VEIELNKGEREQAIASIQRYFDAHMDEGIGNIAAGGLLNYFVQELGPLVHNAAVAQVQAHLQAKIQDLDFEAHEAPFQYWHQFDTKRKAK
jgi:uncharacterized protein (DUF2164 family)